MYRASDTLRGYRAGVSPEILAKSIFSQICL